eukprot:15442480-Alexandrium_andersonii.AAC.1
MVLLLQGPGFIQEDPLQQALAEDLANIMFDPQDDDADPLLAQVPPEVASVVHCFQQDLLASAGDAQHGPGDDAEGADVVDADSDDLEGLEGSDDVVEGGHAEAPLHTPSPELCAATLPKWASLNVVENPGWTFWRADTHARIGVIHAVGERGLKAKCSVHKNCVLWLTCPGKFVEAETSLVEWLSLVASSTPKDAAEHAEAGRAIKIAYGMKPHATRRAPS